MSWSDDFNTYDEACEYYGADTPAQIAYMIDVEDREAAAEYLDRIEISGPYYCFDVCPF